MQLEMIDTALPICRDDRGLERVVVTGRPTVGLADQVRFKLKGKLVGTRYVAYKRTKTLLEVNSSDLADLHFNLRNKDTFWAMLNGLYREKLSPQTEVTFLALSKHADTFVDEPLTPLTGKKSRLNTSEFFNIEEDEYLDYEEEYEEYESFEKIRKQKNDAE